MKIYNYGDPRDEILEVLEEYLFLGGCQGVALIPRGENDNHICFLIVTEDDGNWFASKNSSSSFWLEDLEHQLKKAKDWMDNNADPDPDGFGYRFKEIK